jgi:hypothetical protein
VAVPLTLRWPRECITFAPLAEFGALVLGGLAQWAADRCFSVRLIGCYLDEIGDTIDIVFGGSVGELSQEEEYSSARKFRELHPYSIKPSIFQANIAMSKLPVRTVTEKIRPYITFFKWLREWLPLPFSIIAISISSMQFYLSSVLQVDELQIVRDPFLLSLPDHTKAVADLPRDLGILFINSGNRSMAVMHVLLEIGTQAKSTTDLDKCDGLALAADFEPFVIKEKEIVRTDVKLRRVQMVGMEDTLTKESDGHFFVSSRSR